MASISEKPPTIIITHFYILVFTRNHEIYKNKMANQTLATASRIRW